MNISVVIPAHNEEAYIGRCLSFIRQQQGVDPDAIEIVVVLNRCSDATEQVAQSYGAVVVRNDEKNPSDIKNTGVAAASGEWVVTLDADSWMSETVLKEIIRHAHDERACGGGIKIYPERKSVGIVVGYAMMLIPAWFLGLSFGLYWFRKDDFLDIGGFDTQRHIAEDVDFLRRLKAHAALSNRRCRIIKDAHIVTSTRKFDQFGDWQLVRIFWNPWRVTRAIAGVDRKYLDKNWYEVRRIGK